MKDRIHSHPTATLAITLLALCLTACGGSSSGQPEQTGAQLEAPDVSAGDEQQAPTAPTEDEQSVESDPGSEPAKNLAPVFTGESEFSVVENEQAGIILIEISDADDDDLSLAMSGADALCSALMRAVTPSFLICCRTLSSQQTVTAITSISLSLKPAMAIRQLPVSTA